MNQSIFVYGPAGCGKTHHSEALRKHFGLGTVVDDAYEGTRLKPEGVLYIGERIPANCGIMAVHFLDAAARAGLEVKSRRRG